MVNFSEIKILIIEDELSVAEHIKDGILKLKGENESSFLKENIDFHIVEPCKYEDEHGEEKERSKEPTEIFEETKNKIKKTDVVFIDLNLGKNINQGLMLIRQYMYDPYICFIPKYIITSETNFRNLPENEDIEQYTTIIEKPHTEGIDGFKELFEKKQFTKTLPVIVDSYRRLKENINVTNSLKQIEHKIDEGKIDTEEILKIARLNLKTLNKINLDTLKIIEKTEVLENINLTVLKILPQAVSAKKKENVETFIKENLEAYLNDEDFEENFFPDNFNREKFGKSFLKECSNFLSKDMKKEGLSALKDSIVSFAKEEGITDDNAYWCAAKLAGRAVAAVRAIGEEE